MPQLHLPMFPTGVTHITSELAFEKKDGCITYFNGHMPVFTHGEKDLATFRMITSQFLRKRLCQAKRYHPGFWRDIHQREAIGEAVSGEGNEGILCTAGDTRCGGAGLKAWWRRLRSFWREGASEAEVAKKLELKLNTLRKAIAGGADTHAR